MGTRDGRRRTSLSQSVWEQPGDNNGLKQNIAGLCNRSPRATVNLQCYKPKQMERRIRDLARKHQAPDLISFAACCAAIARSCGSSSSTSRSMSPNSIGTRRPSTISRSDSRAVEGSRTQGVRVWSAGCSNGAEPYTIAMLLLDTMPGRHHAIYATDIDRAMLEKAKAGRGMSADDVRGLPARLRDKYMVRTARRSECRTSSTRIVRFDRHDSAARQGCSSRSTSWRAATS